MNFGKQLKEGVITNNPVLVQILGMCPTLAVSTSLFNGLGMGICATIVLMCSNLVISLLRNIIPNKVRIAAFIVIIAGFVTCIDMLLKAFVPALSDSLGVFIPLIVVNCIILGRAEAYASKNPVIPSFFDGLGMGLGFTVGLTAIGIVRELIGSGKIFGFQVMPSAYEPVTIFILAPGAFLVLTLLVALQNRVKRSLEKKGIETKIGSGCTGECASCQESCKGGKNA